MPSKKIGVILPEAKKKVPSKAQKNSVKKPQKKKKKKDNTVVDINDRGVDVESEEKTKASMIAAIEKLQQEKLEKIGSSGFIPKKRKNADKKSDETGTSSTSKESKSKSTKNVKSPKSLPGIKVPFKEKVLGLSDQEVIDLVEQEVAVEVDRLDELFQRKGPWASVIAEMDPSTISYRRINALKTIVSLRETKQKNAGGASGSLETVVDLFMSVFKKVAMRLMPPEQYNLIVEEIRSELEEIISVKK